MLKELPTELKITDGIHIGSTFLLFSAVMLIISGLRQKNKPNAVLSKLGRRSTNPTKDIILGILGTVFTLSIVIVTYQKRRSSYHDVISAIKDKKYQVIEGKVTKFIPMNGTSQKTESFYVSNVFFSYNYNMILDGYTPKYQGGIIDEGKLVRIHYYKGSILRLWVFENKKQK